MNVAEKARRLRNIGLLLATLATCLATISLVLLGNWYLWAANCVIFIAAASCVMVNQNILNRNSH